LLPLHEPENVLGDEPLAGIAFADPVLAEAPERSAPQKTPAQKIALPDWALRPAPAETAPQKPFAPSHLAAESEPPAASPDILYARGRIIHRLLQSLPDVEDAKRDAAAARFLANPQHRLPQAEQKEIANEVLCLLRDPAFAPLFGPGSRAEAPLAGFYDGKPVSGQIDRLCLRDDAVWIVDYKSNRPPPARLEDVSIAYRKQLAAYRAVLAEIYPAKPIRCFLLWTYAPKLMEIPPEMMEF
jgi:ATP-dependent helicase/nuclease subunit A